MGRQAPKAAASAAGASPFALTHRASRITHLVLLLALLAACSIAVPGVGGPPPARIAYVTPDGLIATFSPGGRPTVISPTAPNDADDADDPARRRYNWPSWSPDGRRVAFLAYDGIGNSGAVLVAEPNGANRVVVQELPYGYPVYLSWSPDSASLAMLATGEDSLRLLVGDISGRGDVRAVGVGQPLYSSWSPDSASLIVHTNGSYFSVVAGRLAVVSARTEAAPERVDIDPETFRAPAWSPTGAYQAIAGDNGIGRPALFLRTRDGVLRRFEEIAGPAALVWSPTGDRLAWSALDGSPLGYDGLHIATPDGKTRQRLTDDRLFAFFWSPDGARIAYFAVDESRRAVVLRVLPSAGGPARTVAAFQPTREFVQLITFFDQYAQSVSIWSPDNRTLLFAGWPPEAETDAPASLYAVPADGSAPAEALTPGRIGFYAPEPRQAGGGRP